MSNVTNPNRKNPKIFVSEPIKINLKTLKDKVYRVDLELDGIDHSGLSYEGRVFINNSDASYDTPKRSEDGYVGSIFVFAHGGCYGDSGHCEIRRERRPYDYRYSNPLKPIKKRLIITDYMSKVNLDTNELRVTIVPILPKDIPTVNVMDFENVVNIETIRILAYK